ncbi:hypothetical protein DI44_18265 [Geobacillus sp. CAMR5420]|nr:hypothetical protein DI44_18265 [Geobacillus sp. CAMR5420]
MLILTMVYNIDKLDRSYLIIHVDMLNQVTEDEIQIKYWHRNTILFFVYHSYIEHQRWLDQKILHYENFLKLSLLPLHLHILILVDLSIQVIFFYLTKPNLKARLTNCK